MDEGKTLIINLAKGRLGADVSNIVGGLVVSQHRQRRIQPPEPTNV